MSVPVSLDKLRVEVERFGPTAYLLTVSDDGRPHATSAQLAWDGDRLTTRGGRRTVANIVRTPAVSLLWPPVEPGGYSLIVDVEGAPIAGTGAAAGESSDANVALTPTTAVLHRSAALALESLVPAGQGDACGSDCVPLG